MARAHTNPHPFLPPACFTPKSSEGAVLWRSVPQPLVLAIRWYLDWEIAWDYMAVGAKCWGRTSWAAKKVSHCRARAARACWSARHTRHGWPQCYSPASSSQTVSLHGLQSWRSLAFCQNDRHHIHANSSPVVERIFR